MAWERYIQEVDTLFKVNGFATVLSLIGSLYMVCCSMKIPSPRTASFKLIIALAWSDLIYSIANIMSQFQGSRPEVSLFCKIEGALRAVSYIPSLFFTTCIAIICYKTTRYGKNFKEDRFFIITSSLISVFCLSVVLAPFYNKKYIAFKNSDFYCEISYSEDAESSRSKVVIELVLEVIPVLGGIIVNLVAYIATIKRLNRLHASFLGVLNVSLRKLLWYPAVMMIVFVPSALDNLFLACGEKPPFALTALHLFMTHSIGFSNAIVYGIQRNLHQSMNGFETEDEESYRELTSESTCSARNELVFANASRLM